MSLLHVEEPWQCCAQAKRFRIGCVNAADHRLRHALKCLFPESSPYKTGKRFIIDAICTFPWQKKIGNHARFACETKNVAGDEWPYMRRREQLKSFRHAAQAAISYDETATIFFVGLNK